MQFQLSAQLNLLGLTLLLSEVSLSFADNRE